MECLTCKSPWPRCWMNAGRWVTPKCSRCSRCRHRKPRGLASVRTCPRTVVESLTVRRALRGACSRPQDQQGARRTFSYVSQPALLFLQLAALVQSSPIFLLVWDTPLSLFCSLYVVSAFLLRFRFRFDFRISQPFLAPLFNILFILPVTAVPVISQIHSPPPP